MPNIYRDQARQLEASLKMPLFAMEEVSRDTIELPDRDIRWSLIHQMGGISAQQCELEDLSESTRLQLHLLYNLENYIYGDREISSSELRDHQRTVFEDIYKFIAQPKSDDEGKPIRRGYVKLPTGSGKTAIFSTLVDVLTRPVEEGGKRLKALVLVPKLDLVAQTVGVSSVGEPIKGFARFAEDVDISEYHGNTKNLNGDTVIMTYQSLPNAIEKGVIGESTFDIVVCDEAHRSLSKKRRDAIEFIARDKTVIGLTASPSFEKRKVEDFFTENIHDLELRECIELGMLSPVRCFAVCSDSSIETIKKGEFSDEELATLIDDEWRNQKAVEFAKAFIEYGQQGVIACLPGGNVRHARIIASRLSKQHVKDPLTGIMRPIRAMTVHGNLDNRDEVYALFESGGIDVLTYVDQLTEGWDSEKAKFIINLRPTTSPVNAIQRIGRVLRKVSDESVVASVVEFIDNTDKDLFTFFSVFNEDRIEQGKIIGGKGKSRRRDGWDNSGADLYDDNEDSGNIERRTLELNPELLSLIAKVDHITVSKLEILMGQIKPADEEILSINAFAKINGFDPHRVMKAIDDLHMSVDRFRFVSRISGGLTLDQQTELLQYPDLAVSASDETIMSLNSFTSQYGISMSSLKKIIQESGMDVGKYRFGRGQVSGGLTPDQQTVILSHPQLAIPNAPTGIVSVGKFASEIKVSPKTLEILLEEIGIKTKEYKFSGRIAEGLSVEQQDYVRSLRQFK